jgi:hypothetical protein
LSHLLRISEPGAITMSLRIGPSLGTWIVSKRRLKPTAQIWEMRDASGTWGQAWQHAGGGGFDPTSWPPAPSAPASYVLGTSNTAAGPAASGSPCVGKGSSDGWTSSMRRHPESLSPFSQRARTEHVAGVVFEYRLGSAAGVRHAAARALCKACLASVVQDIYSPFKE